MDSQDSAVDAAESADYCGFAISLHVHPEKPYLHSFTLRHINIPTDTDGSAVIDGTADGASALEAQVFTEAAAGRV